MTRPHETSETPQICYAMAYFLLPRYCSERRESLLQNLRMGPKAGAAFFYVMTCKLSELEPREDVVHSLSVDIGKLDDATNFYIITYPTPPNVDISQLPEADIMQAVQQLVLAPYFSAVIENTQTDKLSYYILGQSPDGGTTLRTVEGTINANLGPGCEPSLSSFVQLLRDRVAG